MSPSCGRDLERSVDINLSYLLISKLQCCSRYVTPSLRENIATAEFFLENLDNDRKPTSNMTNDNVVIPCELFLEKKWFVYVTTRSINSTLSSLTSPKVKNGQEGPGQFVFRRSDLLRVLANYRPRQRCITNFWFISLWSLLHFRPSIKGTRCEHFTNKKDMVS